MLNPRCPGNTGINTRSAPPEFISRLMRQGLWIMPVADLGQHMRQIDGCAGNQFHQKDEAHHSYNVAINEILYDLLKIDQLAADLVVKLPETAADPIVEHTQEIVSEKILSDILKVPHLRFPDQPRMFSGIQRDRDRKFYRRLLATSPETLSVSLELKIGPMTRSYELLPKGSA